MSSFEVFPLNLRLYEFGRRVTWKREEVKRKGGKVTALVYFFLAWNLFFLWLLKRKS